MIYLFSINKLVLMDNLSNNVRSLKNMKYKIIKINILKEDIDNKDLKIKLNIIQESDNKQSTGLKRNTLDKYYTNSSIVDMFCSKISDKLDINNESDLIIEPSAGNGAFINNIKQLTKNYKFYDISPDNSEIVKQDYLKLDYKQFKHFNKIHIIGNPPFGRQSTHAIKFIKASCKFCNSISFILPKSFKKDSLKKHFPVKFHLIHEDDLPNNSFNVNGVIYDVPCVMQIWVKKDINREVPKKPKPINFKFVKKDEEPDIAFRRVGVYAGKIHTDIEISSSQSHYYIKFSIDITEDTMNKLKNITFDCKNNTVGPKSISKPELIKKFNNILAI